MKRDKGKVMKKQMITACTVNPRATRGGASPTKASTTTWVRRFGCCLSLALGLGLSGCGTTSSLKAGAGKSVTELARFNKIVIQDFADGASARVKGEKKIETLHKLGKIKASFPDLLAEEIERTGAFQQVTRSGVVDRDTLLVAGEISRYDEGNADLRLWVGMGAGSSYFDASVEFRDGLTRGVLGTIQVDKNSWGLGGMGAAGQTPETFMREAARKIASELQKAKTVPPAAASEAHH